jgi:hypothetical protein
MNGRGVKAEQRFSLAWSASGGGGGEVGGLWLQDAKLRRRKRGDRLSRGRNAATILSERCASREEEFGCARENAGNGVARCCLMDMVVEEAESCLLRSP